MKTFQILFAAVWCAVIACGTAPSSRDHTTPTDPPATGQCGNNTADPGETCDGSDLRGQNCATLGHQPGALACTGDCLAFVTDGCGTETVAGPVTVIIAGSDPAITTVVFLNADGSLAASLPADADGRAIASVTPGGSVAVVTTHTSHTTIDYTLGVEPGDEIPVSVATSTWTEINVTVPTIAEPEPQYWFLARCASIIGQSNTLPLRVLPGCDRADLLVRANRANLPFTDYGSFLVPDLDLTAGPIDLTGYTFLPATAVTHTLTNTPTTLYIADGQIQVTTPTAGFWMSAASASAHTSHAAPFSPSTTAPAEVPSVNPTEMLVETTFQCHLDPSEATTSRSINMVWERTPFTTAYELDLSSLEFQTVTSPVVMDDTGTARWTETGVDTAEWITGHFETRRPTEIIRRSFTAPHAGPSVRLPTLPGEFAGLNPAPGDTMDLRHFFVGRSPGGYATFRQTSGDITAVARKLLTQPGDRMILTFGNSY